ncbi:MAG: thermonuclease family protein [Planctomycetota bacterium]|nr:thermonuclease family protein [Planctomycetota bacterium]
MKKKKSKLVLWATVMGYALPLAAILFTLPFLVGDSGGAAVSVRPDEITVVDGNTVKWNGALCRLAGFDAPEPAQPELWDGDQQPWAEHAAELLRARIAGATRLELAEVNAGDTRGRKLIHLYINGVTAGVWLITARLAYPNVDRDGDHGFPAEAEALREAAMRAAQPEFEDPHSWRQTHARD